MNRKNWSNLFIFLAALNVTAGVLPANPMKLANWIAIPCCLALGAIARQRMIPKAVLSAVTAFGKEEDGQDVIEYSLLLSFVALSSVALLAGVGTTVKGVWTTINSTLRNAAS
jgi:Flp pilus assembly pilin Flp